MLLSPEYVFGECQKFRRQDLVAAAARQLNLGVQEDGIDPLAKFHHGQKSFQVIAKSQACWVGGAVAEALGQLSQINLVSVLPDGQWVTAGDVVAQGNGPWDQLICWERAFLNCVHLTSGIATAARRLIDELGSKRWILDTRKTLPGFRLLSKQATVLGGARSHRRNLNEIVMVKDTADRSQISAILTRYPVIEVEVETWQDLQAILDLGPQIIMIDNQPDCASWVQLIQAHPKKFVVEVSGGLDLKALQRLDKLLPPEVCFSTSLLNKPVLVDFSWKVIS